MGVKNMANFDYRSHFHLRRQKKDTEREKEVWEMKPSNILP